jgi:hypothetical protein
MWIYTSTPPYAFMVTTGTTLSLRYYFPDRYSNCRAPKYEAGLPLLGFQRSGTSHYKPKYLLIFQLNESS